MRGVGTGTFPGWSWDVDSEHHQFPGRERPEGLGQKCPLEMLLLQLVIRLSLITSGDSAQSPGSPLEGKATWLRCGAPSCSPGDRSTPSPAMAFLISQCGDGCPLLGFCCG